MRMKNDWGPLGGWRMLPDGSYRRVYADNAAARKSGKTRAFDRARRATVSFWDGAWHYEVMELELPGQAVRKVVARGSECFVVAFAAFGPADEAATTDYGEDYRSDEKAACAATAGICAAALIAIAALCAASKAWDAASGVFGPTRSPLCANIENGVYPENIDR